MNLETIIYKTARPLVLFGAGIYLLVSTACGSSATPTVTPSISPPPKPSPTETYNPKPTATLEPYTPTPTKEPTPAITPTTTLETKLFEFVFPSGTPEQYEIFSKNALEDYRTVLNVYGINEKDARLKINVYLETYPNGYSAQRYSIGFFFGDKSGSAGGISIDDFTTDRRGLRHEMSHAINHTLFPTYHLWFDEGMANYSGGIKDFNINDPRVKAMVGQLNSNPNKFWESEIEAYTFPGSTNTPTHLIGSVFYYTLRFDYGLTEEQNRSAILYLADAYSSNGQEISRTDIQNAYEKALGKNLTAVFDIIGLGNKILWNAIMKAKPNQDYTEVKKMLSEF